jgi:hypothetical protein
VCTWSGLQRFHNLACTWVTKAFWQAKKDEIVDELRHFACTHYASWIVSVLFLFSYPTLHKLHVLLHNPDVMRSVKSHTQPAVLLGITIKVWKVKHTELLLPRSVSYSTRGIKGKRFYKLNYRSPSPSKVLCLLFTSHTLRPFFAGSIKYSILYQGLRILIPSCPMSINYSYISNDLCTWDFYRKFL